jgi:hypothetical protein
MMVVRSRLTACLSMVVPAAMIARVRRRPHALRGGSG